ncbi:hypothetical protein L1049_003320 [Liquidambar formosana]|uniref:Uncharacterized protein n=1 Tax=Liquidambar formosana TaxID=63359 RepID=A0AAP0R9K0_LIQFO
MDFHSLARKELQALCKKNKIAANMTNVAMADALKALQHVEGIEEFMNPSESETPLSPEKPVIGSPDIPRTVCKTSTRRRPVKEEPESSQPLTQSRRGTRRRTAGEAKEEKKDVPETLAMQSSRKRAPAASSCRKTEIQEENHMESSVQRVYSTRQSVRLAEKKMAELSLKERGRTAPIKIDDLSKEGSEVSGDSDGVEDNKGADSQTISEEVLERTNNSDGNSNKHMEIERVVEDEAHDKNKGNQEEAFFSVQSNVDNVLSSLVTNVYFISAGTDLQTKPEVGCERTDESDELDVQLGENSEKAMDLSDKTIEKKGPDDFPVTMFLFDAEKSIEVLKSETVQDLITDQDMGSDDSSHVPGNIMEFVAPPQSSLPQEVDYSASLESGVNNDSTGDYENPEVNSLSNVRSSADHQNLLSKDSDMNLAEDHHGIQDPESEFATVEESSDGKVLDENSSESQESDCDDDLPQYQMDPFEQLLGSKELIQVPVGLADEEGMNFSNVEADDQPMLEIEKINHNSNAWIDENSSEFQESGRGDGGDDLPQHQMGCLGSEKLEFEVPVVFAGEEESKNSGNVEANDQPMPEMESNKKSNAWVDYAYEIEAEKMTTTHECQSPSSNKTPTSVKQRSPLGPLVSDGKDAGEENPLSTWAVDPLLGHIPRPTQLTPRKSSTKKKQTTIQRHVSDDDKENIDKSTGRKVEPRKEKEKKLRKETAEKSLNEASLRQLTKMLKEKLQISNDNKNNDDNKNVSKQEEVGKKRPALQTLTENQMAAGGPVKEN